MLRATRASHCCLSLLTSPELFFFLLFPSPPCQRRHRSFHRPQAAFRCRGRSKWVPPLSTSPLPLIAPGGAVSEPPSGRFSVICRP